MPRPTVIHLTTVDMSLALLLLPQLVAFRDAGYDVIGVSAPGPYTATLQQHGIRHVPLKRSTRAHDFRADLVTAWEFVDICRRLRPDIVHTHNPKPGIYGRLGARLARVPHVVNTVHGLYAQPTDRLRKRAVVYALERLASLCSEVELVQNVEDLDTLRRLRVPEHKLYLLGNGVDLRRFDPGLHADGRRRLRADLGVGDDEVLVGLVARLVREKGYREVFEAARLLRSSHPRLRFAVVGPREDDKSDGLTASELTAASQEGGILFLGPRADMERLYPAMDLYVLASHREGFPRAAMEAAAMGIPVIATDIRGCRQVVDHGRTGLLVPVRDPAALSRAIATLADDTERRRSMGRAARAKAAAEFDDRVQVRITLEVYGQLLGRREPGSV